MTSTISASSADRGPAGDHLPGLDGLRAVAIATVFGFHLGLPGMSLGWVGVQLFFVISGFLITGILLRSRDRAFYFRNFYVRRTLRIFPIYYVLIALYFVAAGLEGDFATLKLLPYFLTYTQTYPQLTTQYACAPMLGHTWTLAIEEQFYLLWPLAIYLLRARWLLVALGGLMVAAVGTRVALHDHPNAFLSVGWLPPQIDLLASGAAIAVFTMARPQAWTRRLGYLLTGAGTILTAVVVIPAGLAVFWSPVLWVRLPLGPYLPTGLAVLFAGIVTLTATGCPLTRWLANRPMMRIGKISYGLYLFHPFVFRYVDQLTVPLHPPGLSPGLNRLAVMGIWAAKVAATVLIAECSWRFFEGPINNLKDRLTRRSPAPGAAKAQVG